MPHLRFVSWRYSHVWIAFGPWTPLSTPGSRCCRRGRPATGGCPGSLSERKTSSRRGIWLLNTARRSTKDESALLTPQLFVKCASAERYCWERRRPPPSHIAHLPPRATRGIWSTRRVEAPAGRRRPLRRGRVPLPFGEKHT